MSISDKFVPYFKRRRVTSDFHEPSLTVQSEKRKCCVNGIMARYIKTGVVEHVRDRIPNFANVADIPDFQTSMAIMADAQSAFEALPSNIRREFDNDPRAFATACFDPSQRPTLERLGILQAKTETTTSAPQEAGDGVVSEPPKEA